MPEVLRDEVVLKRVRKYIKRMHNCNSLLPAYSLEEEGLFRVIGAVDESDCKRFDIEHSIVKGRFIDAIAYAVRLSYFYPAGAPQDPGNSQSGYVIKIELVELEDSKSLDAIVTELERQGIE